MLPRPLVNNYDTHCCRKDKKRTNNAKHSRKVSTSPSYCKGTAVPNLISCTDGTNDFSMRLSVFPFMAVLNVRFGFTACVGALSACFSTAATNTDTSGSTFGGGLWPARPS